jgi:hypothetical protein
VKRAQASYRAAYLFSKLKITLTSVTPTTTYTPTRLPDCNPPLFQIKTNRIRQQDIRDDDNKLIPPWEYKNLLRPGTLAIFNVSLECFNLSGQNGFRRVRTPLIKDPSQIDFFKKKYYQMNMIKGHVLHKSKEPVKDFPNATITNPNNKKPTTNSPSLAAFTQIMNKTTETPQVKMHTSKSTTAVTSTTKK